MRRRTFWGTVWRILYPILIFEGASLAASSAVTVGLIFLRWNDIMPMLMQTGDIAGVMDLLTGEIYSHYTIISVITYAICIPLFLLFMRKDRRDPALAHVVASRGDTSPVWYTAAFVMGVCLCLTLNNLIVLSRLSEVFSDGFDQVAELIYQGPLWLEVLVTGIIGPLMEELLFRGLVYRRLRETARVVPAVLISAAIFGAIHGNFLQFVYAFLVGTVLAYACERFRSVLAPFCIHAGANIASVLLTETGLADPLYETEAGIWALTSGMMIGFLGLAYLLLVKVNAVPADVPELPEPAPADPMDNRPISF